MSIEQNSKKKFNNFNISFYEEKEQKIKDFQLLLFVV